MRRAAALALAASVILAACGADEEGGAGKTDPTPRPARTAPGIDRVAALAEARSAASQDAVRRDYSIPPTAFAATCDAPGDVRRSRTWDCRVRSIDRRCRGALRLNVTPAGAVTTTRARMTCRGDSRRG